MLKSFTATPLLVLLLGHPLRAQCVANLRDELWALDDVARAIEERTFPVDAQVSAGKLTAGTTETAKDPKAVTGGQRWKLFTEALGDDGLYLGKLARAGVAMPCLIDKRDL